MRQILLLWILLSTTAWAVTPLVESDWLAARLGDPKLVLLDIQPAEYYQQVHLPDAIHAPYALWRSAAATGVPDMLPPIGLLETRLGRLGIAPDDTLVIVVTGFSADEMAAAARVYWTLKILGHREAAILNGGLAAFAEDERRAALLTDAPASRAPTRYQAVPDFDLLADTDATVAALAAGQQLIDARSRAEYLGIHVAGEGERPGTLPTARNLPFDWLTENGSARILPAARLRALMQAVGVDTEAPQVHFCHSGNRAALNWFVAHALLGNPQARLYDGSVLEWERREELPMLRQVDF